MRLSRAHFCPACAMLLNTALKIQHYVSDRADNVASWSRRHAFMVVWCALGRFFRLYSERCVCRRRMYSLKFRLRSMSCFSVAAVS
jgi:hypothetical protein